MQSNEFSDVYAIKRDNISKKETAKTETTKTKLAYIIYSAQLSQFFSNIWNINV